jgi:chromosome segregation ATPase
MVDLELSRERRREIAVAMVDAMRQQVLRGEAASISPPGLWILLEFLDERAKEFDEQAQDLAELKTTERDLLAERNSAFAQVTRLGEDCAQLKEQLDEVRATALIHRLQGVEAAEASAVRTRTLTRERDEARHELAKEQEAHQSLSKLYDLTKAALARAGEMELDQAKRVDCLTRQRDGAQARAHGAERRLANEARMRAALAQALVSALNDRLLMGPRLDDMASRLADLQEVLLREVDDEGRGVVVIELGEKI